MAIDLENGFNDLLPHANHDIECVTYGGAGEAAWNVAVECLTCNEVLIDFDHPTTEPAPAQSAHAEPGSGPGGEAGGQGR